LDSFHDFIIKDFWVIALGCFKSIKSRRVGAISPKTPELIFLFSGSTKIIGTGLVVCAVFWLPSGFHHLHMPSIGKHHIIWLQ